MRREPGDQINCWIVYLMPVEKENRNNYDMINDLQQLCIDNNIFGMGWAIDDDNSLSFGLPIQEGKNVYQELYGEDSGLEKALNNYEKIKQGDYVLIRLKNGHYYVGKTIGSAFYMHKNGKPFKYLSWGCKVEKWEHIPEEDVPSELRGRMSQRYHPTIQRIVKYRPRLLTMKLYEDRKSVSRLNIPPIRFTYDNFIRCLDYKQLEDLAAIYIWEKYNDEGYMLLPSSGKSNQQKYEFRFINVKDCNRKPIVCQVKNQNKIKVERYKNEPEYEKIFLFCGMWTDDDIKEMQFKYGATNLTFISRMELFKTLKESLKFTTKMYITADDGNYSVEDIVRELDEMGYRDCGKKLRKRGEKKYIWTKEEKDFISFVVGDCLFYSDEFGALICSGGDYTDKEIEKLKDDLSKCLSNLAKRQ